MNLLEEYKKCFGKFSQEETFTDTEYNIEIDNVEKKIYLRFRGSGPIEDWKQNFDFEKELEFHFKSGKLKKPFKTFFFVHDGIYQKYVSVRNELHINIEPYLKQEYILFIHGFSQGAGLTVIAHEDFWYYLYENGLNVNKVISYAFAPPMVFGIISSKEFRKRFDNLTVIRNINDVVSRVPGLIFGYRHYGNVITIGKWNWHLLMPWKWIDEHLGYKEIL